MRTDEQTDMTKLIITFRNFANAPKKLPVLHPAGKEDVDCGGMMNICCS
jgi:hypothetical protein